jgi:small subunit ribosomal protein S15
MPIAKEKKQEIISKYRINEKDTGSIELQVALLTERINSILEHLKRHKKDFSSQRSLLKLVGKRRRFLLYLKSNDYAKYKSLIEKLGLRK